MYSRPLGIIVKKQNQRAEPTIDKWPSVAPGSSTSVTCILPGSLKVILAPQWLTPLQPGLEQVTELRGLISGDRLPKLEVGPLVLAADTQN